jgi:DNA-binding MarR family transcriptional regulator
MSPIPASLPPMEPLLELALAVKAGQREFERWVNESMRPLGVTAAQAEAITVIGQAGPLSLKELGELLIAEAGHPSRLVDRLVEAGWVQRRVAQEDRRRVELSLTPRGKELEERIFEARQATLAAGRELVGDRDLEPLLAVLRDLLELTPYAPLIARRRELFEKEASIRSG